MNERVQSRDDRAKPLAERAKGQDAPGGMPTGDSARSSAPSPRGGPASAKPKSPGDVERILGIDPGLRLTGYGVIDFPHRESAVVGLGSAALVDAGVIRLDGKTAIASRLVELEREITAILSEHRPAVVAVEMLYSNYAHPRTALLMAHARGVILLCAQRQGCELVQIPANRVKQSLTGFGHASKGAMQRAVQDYWKLKAPPEPPDVADALAVALCCGRARV